MKKVKVTRRPEIDDFALRPSLLRMSAVNTVVFMLAVGFGFLIRLAFNSKALEGMDWPFVFGAIVTGAIVVSFFDTSRWVLRVHGGKTLEGPGVGFGERAELPVDSIDWLRTHRSLSSRLKIGNSIYAETGQRLLVTPWFYHPAKFTAFLNRIGYEPAAQLDQSS